MMLSKTLISPWDTGALHACSSTQKIRQNIDPKPKRFPWWETWVGSCSGLHVLAVLFLLWPGKNGRHMPLDFKTHANVPFFFSLYSRGSQWPTSWHPRSQPFMAVSILPCTKSPKPQDDQQGWLNSTIALAGPGSVIPIQTELVFQEVIVFKGEKAHTLYLPRHSLHINSQHKVVDDALSPLSITLSVDSLFF